MDDWMGGQRGDEWMNVWMARQRGDGWMDDWIGGQIIGWVDRG